MTLVDQVVRTDDEVNNRPESVPQEPAGRQKRHAEQSNPFAPEGNHYEYSPLRYAFQFNDWKMFAIG
jgi:hypothetical protein